MHLGVEHYSEDLDIPIYLVITGKSPSIPWEDIVADDDSYCNESADGTIKIFRLKETAYTSYPEALTGTEMANYINANEAEWTYSLDIEVSE